MTDSQPLTLLVVEDEPLIRQLVVMALEETGARIVEASNVDEAEAALNGIHALDGLVSDVQMPGSRDGVDLAALVRKRFPDCFIVLTSGRSLPTDRPIPQRTRYISKPWSVEGLTEFVSSELDAALPTAGPQ